MKLLPRLKRHDYIQVLDWGAFLYVSWTSFDLWVNLFDGWLTFAYSKPLVNLSIGPLDASKYRVGSIIYWGSMILYDSLGGTSLFRPFDYLWNEIEWSFCRAFSDWKGSDLS